MRDEVAGLGGDLDARIEPGGTDARLDGIRVQVSNFRESAPCGCRRCGDSLPDAPNPGSPRVHCLDCRPTPTTPRNPTPCIGCSGDVGPLGRRGRMRVRCRSCRARAGLERQRRNRELDPKWNASRACRFCGTEFQPRSRTDHRRRSCYECGLVPHRRWSCLDCGTSCARRGGRCDPCERQRRARPACVCRSCGTTYVPKTADRVSFCSRDCAYTYQHDRRVEREERDAATRDVLVEGTCVQCGRWFAARRRREICSDRCRTERARLAQRVYYAERLARPREHRECEECGTPFQAPVSAPGRFVYCSHRCGRRASKRNRKAARRQGWRSSVSRVAIVRRDRNQCGICGFRILADAGPGWAGTLDHIVPLSRGGLHCAENVQLAHLVCNSTKCDGRRTDWRQRLDKRLRTNSPFAHFFTAEVRCG